MSGMTISFELLLLCVTMTLLFISIIFASVVPGMDRWSKRFFITFFAVLLLYGGVALAELIIIGRPGSGLALGILFYIDSFITSILVPMLTAYLLHCCGESLKGSRLFQLLTALWIGFFILLNITPFTTLVYYVLPGNSLGRSLGRGPLYPLMLGILLVMALISLAGVIMRRKRLAGKYYCAFLVSLIPMAASMFLHFFITAFEFFELGIAICVFSMYIIILSDQIEENMRQQQEIARQRANVMILQMRPHFIYNTLMSIYSLCDQDPGKARQVTMDFTSYLQKNFNAVASGNLIPFAAELEHTRAYLAVEQAQYDEMLFVKYDTQFMQFRLPPLTLQPIVENAVKHGINPYSGPLHVLIRTRHTGSGSVITVEDNGPGFSPDEDSGPHTALMNIRQRLEMMCSGTMTITPRREGGTVVEVTIPG